MSLFTPLGFTRLATKHRDILERIADDLTLPGDPAHASRREQFLKTAETMNNTEADRMIDQALCAYSGCRSVTDALTRFCEQMGIPTNELSRMSDSQRIAFIDGFRDKIGARLR